MNTKRKWILTVAVGLTTILIFVQYQYASAHRDSICFDPLSEVPPQEKPVVGVCQSSDAKLPSPVGLDSELTDEQVDKMTRLAVQRAGGFSDVIQPGDWIIIKPNIVVTPFQEESKRFAAKDSFLQGNSITRGIVTDLRVVKSVIEQLIEEGDASRITVAEGKAWRNTSKLGNGEEDGWTGHWQDYGGLSYDEMIKNLAVSTKIKIDYMDLDYSATSPYTKDVPVPGGGLSQDSYTIPDAILKCDRLIGVAVMKTNLLAKVTLVHKLFIGIAPAEVYSKYGFDHFLLPHGEYKQHKQFGVRWDHTIDRTIVDLVSYHPPDFGIIEGIWGMEGEGPVFGSPIKRNLIIAGKDPVAVDAVGAYVMGFNPWDIEYLHLSRNKGFGKTLDVKHISINGPKLDKIRYEFKKSRISPQGRGIRTWLLNGPYYGEDINHDYLAGEQSASPVAGDITAGKSWTLFQDYTDYMDLFQYYKKPGDCITYAFVRIIAERAMKDVHLRFGSVDGIKIWLNGKNIYTNGNTGDFEWIKNDLLINLIEGENRLLVKVKNTTGDKGFDTAYGFSMYVSEEDGDTPFGIKYLISPTKDTR